MILREPDGMYLQCDFCPTYEGEFETFNDAVRYKRTHNWRSVKIKGEWFDKCPECASPRRLTDTHDSTSRSIHINLGGKYDY